MRAACVMVPHKHECHRHANHSQARRRAQACTTEAGARPVCAHGRASPRAVAPRRAPPGAKPARHRCAPLHTCNSLARRGTVWPAARSRRVGSMAQCAHTRACPAHGSRWAPRAEALSECCCRGRCLAGGTSVTRVGEWVGPALGRGAPDRAGVIARTEAHAAIVWGRLPPGLTAPAITPICADALSVVATLSIVPPRSGMSRLAQLCGAGVCRRRSVPPDGV